MKNIVTIGGGTGQFTLLSGLKKFPVNLTATVSMADDGGSTGVLRDELGVLPPGDIRQCLVALSESEEIVRELFNYRFETGGMKGHSFGNIFLSALEKISGNFNEAVRVSGKVLATRGKVVPVTTQNARLVMKEGATVSIRGQYAIETSPLPQNYELKMEPEVFANPKAVEAIENADCIIIGPGAIFTSLLPNLIVKGIPEAIRRSHASVVFNCNLMNKPGHTDGFTVGDYIELIEQYIGGGRVNFVTCNNKIPERELVEKYAKDGEHTVHFDVHDAGRTGASVLASDLISKNIPVQKEGDPIKRTLIRHNPDLLASMIVSNCLGGL